MNLPRGRRKGGSFVKGMVKDSHTVRRVGGLIDERDSVMGWSTHRKRAWGVYFVSMW